MKKTVVFGGTFDPPHAGHKNLLLNVMSEGYDNAIVIPASDPPHKTGTRTPFEIRYALTKQMFEAFSNVTVSDIETKRQDKSYTYVTLRMLSEQYADTDFYLLIGSDMFLCLEKWVRFDEILKNTFIITAARNNDDVIKLREHKKHLEKNYDCKGIIIYDINIVEISSTFLRSDLVRKIESHNRAHLSKSRAMHVQSVADYSVYLAGLHGISPQSAYIAALAHDCTKYMTEKEALCYLEERGIALSEDEKKCPKIFHQITGAVFAKETFGIEDPDILNAVRYHTTGRAGMSPLEKLICLADSIEPIRDFDGVESMRDMAKTDLDKALLMSFDRLVEYIKQRGLEMHPQTLTARDWLKGQING